MAVALAVAEEAMVVAVEAIEVASEVAVVTEEGEASVEEEAEEVLATIHPRQLIEETLFSFKEKAKSSEYFFN